MALASTFVLLMVSVTALSTLAVAGDGGVEEVEADIEMEAPEDTGYEEYVVRFGASDADTVSGLKEDSERMQEAFLERARDDERLTVLNTFWISNSVLVEAPEDLEDDLKGFSGVERVHPNYRFTPVQAVPGRGEGPPREIGYVERSHGYPVDYGVEMVNASAVWNETMGDDVKIAVLDTGVEPSHEDIDLFTTDRSDTRYPGGWSEFDSTGVAVDSEPYDAGIHGTHVSGTTAGGDSSGVWIGVAPEADLMHSKVFDVSGSFSQINAGMQWAVENDADVMGMSFGVLCEEEPSYVPVFIEPLRNAEAAGTFVVAATGNNGEGCTSSPSNVPEAFAVGAVDRYERVPEFSSGGEVNTSEAWGDAAYANWSDSYVVPDVVAPGVEIVSAVPDGGFRQMDGTSMAAPHVSAAAALVQSATDEQLEPGELREALTESTWKPDDAPSSKDVRYGDGVVDVYEAVEHAKAQYEEDEEEEEEEADDETEEVDDVPESLPGFGVAAALLAFVAFAAVSRKT